MRSVENQPLLVLQMEKDCPDQEQPPAQRRSLRSEDQVHLHERTRLLRLKTHHG